jgi:hypothetical protein
VTFDNETGAYEIGEVVTQQDMLSRAYQLLKRRRRQFKIKLEMHSLQKAGISSLKEYSYKFFAELVYTELMQSVGDVLKKFNPQTDKYISREFQNFGIHLAETLDDYKHKSLYIKLAKTMPRAVLEKALSFSIDSTAKNKGALFMWKLKQLRDEMKKTAKSVDTAK